jgi:hypothetical protein
MQVGALVLGQRYSLSSVCIYRDMAIGVAEMTETEACTASTTVGWEKPSRNGGFRLRTPLEQWFASRDFELLLPGHVDRRTRRRLRIC